MIQRNPGIQRNLMIQRNPAIQKNRESPAILRNPPNNGGRQRTAYLPYKSRNSSGAIAKFAFIYRVIIGYKAN